jgi:hypothetical protein
MRGPPPLSAAPHMLLVPEINDDNDNDDGDDNYFIKIRTCG